jgi:hypothetical protein
MVPLRASVTECVVDEIAERLFEPQTVAAERDRVGFHLERAALGSRPLIEAASDRLEKLVCGDRRGAQRKSSLIETCQDQQVLGEPRQPVDFVLRRAERIPELGGRALVP